MAKWNNDAWDNEIPEQSSKPRLIGYTPVNSGLSPSTKFAQKESVSVYPTIGKAQSLSSTGEAKPVYFHD